MIFAATVVGGELTREVDGTTDEARWIPLAEVPGLGRVGLVDVALGCWPAADAGPGSGWSSGWCWSRSPGCSAEPASGADRRRRRSPTPRSSAPTTDPGSGRLSRCWSWSATRRGPQLELSDGLAAGG